MADHFNLSHIALAISQACADWLERALAPADSVQVGNHHYNVDLVDAAVAALQLILLAALGLEVGERRVKDLLLLRKGREPLDVCARLHESGRHDLEKQHVVAEGVAHLEVIETEESRNDSVDKSFTSDIIRRYLLFG